jgi:hypothetical protein
MITSTKLAKAKALAEKHGKKSGKIILELCAEIEKLRRLTLRKGLYPVSYIEPWPYGIHRGKPMCDLDDEYLREWFDRQNPKGLRFDLDYAAVAERDLALYEHLRKHFKTKPTADVPDPEEVEI